MDHTITLAVQRGSSVYVYFDGNTSSALVMVGELKGYSPKGVTIKRDHVIYFYDAKSRCSSSTIVGNE